MKLYETIKKQLRKEPNFISDDGELKKWVVLNKAQNFDAELIELLLDDPELKEKFFIDVKGVLVFKQRFFIDFLEQKNYLNDSYTQYKNKIGLNIDGKYLKQRNEVALVWPFKDCILEGGQSREEQKREEIFFNEILAQDEITQLLEPKVLTNAKVFDKDGEHAFSGFTRDAELNKKRGLPENTITDNLIIKGNNLLALHSLKREFAGKVKLIYIDPPYNTGGDANIFTYNNSFNHSSWLTFMFNRLEVSKNMLRDDGCIAITIDHNELFYLGTLVDEIFGRENFLGVVSIVIRPQGRQFSKFFSATTEYMLVYSKNWKKARFREVVIDENITYDQKDKDGYFRYVPLMYSRFVEEKMAKARDKYFYPIYVSKDLEDISLSKKYDYYEVWPVNNKREICWKIQKEKLRELLLSKKRERYKALKENGIIQIYEKYREGEGTKIKNHWIGKRYNATASGTEILKTILGRKAFSYPKSLYAVLDTLKIITSNDDIIMDFFAGSGTTGHAALALNKEDSGSRQFILVEQLDEHIKVCNERIQKVIAQEKLDASFTCLELKKHNQTFIEQIETAKDSSALLKIWEQMKTRSFLNYNVDIKKQEEHIEDFKQLSLKKQKQHLCELLDKNQLYVNLSSLNDKNFACTKEEKQLTKDFYQMKGK